MPVEIFPAPRLPEWLAPLLPFRRQVIVAGGQAIHVMEHGDPRGRPVLLLHGNPTWGFLWRQVALLLGSDGLRLVMPDLPGLGYSSRPPASFHSLERHGAVMAALYEALALDGVVFVGQDWGGPIGLQGFLDNPRRLAGLVLANTVVGPPRRGFKPTTFHRLARLPIISELLFRGLGFPQRFSLGQVQGDPSSIRGLVARAYREPLRGLANNAAPLALARMVPDGDAHPSVAPLRRGEELVTSFRGPSALVWGERDPILGRVLHHLERLLPEATVTRTSAGHFLQEEVPEAIAAAIRDVVGRLKS